MKSLIKNFKRLLALFLITMIIPSIASAAKLSPINGNAWDLFVFGNGSVIFDVMTGIKLAMSSGSSFQSILVFLATLGFIILAVAAGFNPAQNLFKMFSYIFVTWAVVFFSTKLTADIVINDSVTNYHNVVTDVPALVGIPASIISGVGQYLTVSFEKNFSVPGSTGITATDGASGGFNLFNRMMQEGQQYVIKNPNLKKSLTAYVMDCGVMAIATGRQGLSLNELQNSTNYLETLRKANFSSVMTKYFPADTTPGYLDSLRQASGVDFSADNVASNPGMGVITSCANAYTALNMDMTTHAAALLEEGAKAWSKTGTMGLYETAMSVTLAQAASGDGTGTAAGVKPEGFILQQAMISGMTGAYRGAAAQTGNNEFLTAAALAQAEQTQKSTWSMGAVVFNNMMGYVYTVLQAFIFAIVPVVIIALMVPGLGKGIFVNYGQILIWLTLWMPMLALINYLITLFSIEQVSSVVSNAGGFSSSNKDLISEKTNMSMIAAQFLGTSVPLLTWGLVKGSLAFTEFISHGIGSNVAAQAGATAATGNMSMGNLSMDNTSMNKYSTVQSSAVGSQAVQADMGSGALNIAQHGGGGQRDANGAAVATAVSSQASLSNASQSQEQFSKAKTTVETDVASIQKSFGKGESFSNSSSLQNSNSTSQTISDMQQHVKSAMSAIDNSVSKGESLSASAQKARSDLASLGASLDVAAGGLGGGAGGGASGGAGGGASLKPGVGADFRQQTTTTNSMSHGLKNDHNTTSKNGVSTSDSNNTSAGTSNATAISAAIAKVRASSQNWAQSESNAHSSANATSTGHSLTAGTSSTAQNTLSSTRSAAETYDGGNQAGNSYAQGVLSGQPSQGPGDAPSIHQQIEAGGAAIAGKTASLSNDANTNFGNAVHAGQAADSHINSGMHKMHGGFGLGDAGAPVDAHPEIAGHSETMRLADKGVTAEANNLESAVTGSAASINESAHSLNPASKMVNTDGSQTHTPGQWGGAATAVLTTALGVRSAFSAAKALAPALGGTAAEATAAGGGVSVAASGSIFAPALALAGAGYAGYQAGKVISDNNILYANDAMTWAGEKSGVFKGAQALGDYYDKITASAPETFYASTSSAPSPFSGSSASLSSPGVGK